MSSVWAPRSWLPVPVREVTASPGLSLASRQMWSLSSIRRRAQVTAGRGLRSSCSGTRRWARWWVRPYRACEALVCRTLPESSANHASAWAERASARTSDSFGRSATFRLANIFVRTAALRRAFDEGHALDDDLCAVLRERQGLVVLCSPDVVVTTQPSPLFGPYLRSLHRLGRDRGSRFGPGRPPRIRHLTPALMLVIVALLPAAIALGGWPLIVWTGAVVAYLGVLVSYWGVIALLHRQPALAALATIGAAASHAAFGSGVLRGAIDRLANRRNAPRRSQPQRGLKTAPPTYPKRSRSASTIIAHQVLEVDRRAPSRAARGPCRRRRPAGRPRPGG